MREIIAFLSLFGLGLMARGFYSLCAFQSENRVGLEMMATTEIGLGTLVLIGSLGVVALLDVLDPIWKKPATETIS